MTFMVATLYNDSDPRNAWNSPAVRAVLDAARPPGILVHTGPTWLADHIGPFADEIRTAYPGSSVWAGVEGDGGGPNPGPLWVRAGQACEAAHVLDFMLDDETGSIHRDPVVLRQDVVSLCTSCPTLRVSLTSAGQPLYIPNVFPPPASSGTTNAYGPMLNALVGLGSPVADYYAQVYYAEATVPAVRGVGGRSQARSRANMAVCVADGYISPGCRVLGYQQIHGCRTDDLAFVGTQYDVCACWALNSSPGYFDTDGVNFLRAMCELERRGFKGPLAVYLFQQANPPLKADNILGPKTLAALGIM